MTILVSAYGLFNSGNNDPNCQRSDFNTDYRVDMEDLEILAEHWLTVVTDEYRICSLCNLYKDPNAMNAINADDMDAFMADWMKRFTSDPNIAITQSASQLSVAVQNPDPAWKISVFFDDEPIGQWTAGELGSTVFDADLTRYGPGSHKVKIVRNIGYGLEINERIVSDANSTGLYFADIVDTFEPNQPYIIQGFNLGGELNVKINNIWDTPIYDVNVPSGAVNLQIPSEVFNTSRICTLRLEGQGYLPEGFCLFAAGESHFVMEKDLVKEFRQADWPYGAMMIIVLPDKDVFRNRKSAVQACAQACENRDVTWVALYHKNVTKGNLEYLYKNIYNGRYIYWCGHANSHVGRDENSEIGGVQRTFTNCWKRTEINLWPDKWEKIPALSWTQHRFPAAPLLPNDWDNRGFDLSSLGMYNSWNKKIVFVDGCLSAAYQDMADAYGAFSLQGQGSKDQIYIGWAASPKTHWLRLLEYFSGDTTEGVRMFWERLGLGDSVENAFKYIDSHGSAQTQKSFFFDTIWNRGGDDNIVIYSLDGVNLNDIKLGY